MNLIGYWLQVIGLVLGFFGAIILTVAEIRTKKEIEAESGTYWDKNPHMEKGLKEKTKLAIFSTILLAIGFGLQLIGLGLSQ